MLQWVEPILRAEDEIAARNTASHLSPERVKYLVLQTTGDKKQAEKAYVEALKNAVSSRKGNNAPQRIQ